MWGGGVNGEGEQGGRTATGSVRVTCFGGERAESRLVGHRRLIVRGSGSCGRRGLPGGPVNGGHASPAASDGNGSRSNDDQPSGQ